MSLVLLRLFGIRCSEIALGSILTIPLRRRSIWVKQLVQRLRRASVSF